MILKLVILRSLPTLFIYDDYNDNVLSADLLFIGSWTFKGEPSDKMKF